MTYNNNGYGDTKFQAYHSQNENQSNVHLVDFEYLVVLDFEATCSKDRSFNPQEIIEWPAMIIHLPTERILVDQQFHFYVKPVIHPVLSNFCTELTGITQDMVDNGCSIAYVVQQWNEWCFNNNLLPDNDDDSDAQPPRQQKAVIVTHGDWDLKTMWQTQMHNCLHVYPQKLEIRETALFHSWIDLKTVFRRIYPSYSGRAGLMALLRYCRLRHVGRHHSGIDDVRNICNIVLHLISKHTRMKYKRKHFKLWLYSFKNYNHRSAETDRQLKRYFITRKKKSGSTNNTNNTNSNARSNVRTQNKLRRILTKQQLMQLQQNLSSSSSSSATATAMADPYPNIYVDDMRTLKHITQILRHGSKSVGLHMLSDGFVLVSDLLSLNGIREKRLTFSDLIQIVLNDGKERFCMAIGNHNNDNNNNNNNSTSNTFYIRANQGHSKHMTHIRSEHLLKPLSAQQIQQSYPNMCHGTYHKHWSSILRKGLNRMNRKHIHFAADVNTMSSKMRASSEILIFVNVVECMQNGIQFFRSSNNVLLTEGDSRGIIGPQCFEQVMQYRGGKVGDVVWKRSTATTSSTSFSSNSNTNDNQNQKNRKRGGRRKKRRSAKKQRGK